MSHRPDPVVTAREVVAERFPRARQAWLSGSVVLGQSTETSDLDLVVVFDDVEVHRETLTFRGWLVEVFAHTEQSVRGFVARDLARRIPSLARMISTGVPLLGDSAGADLRRECADVVAAGPAPLTASELEFARYVLTDQLDDLIGGASPAIGDAIAVDVWRGCAELMLAEAGHWSGTGKWLIREVEALDRARGSDQSTRLHRGLREALAGRPAALIDLAEEILGSVGGRVSDGFYRAAPDTGIS